MVSCNISDVGDDSSLVKYGFSCLEHFIHGLTPPLTFQKWANNYTHSLTKALATRA